MPTFIQYSNLTEAQIKSWIPDYGSNTVILSYLADDISRQANPPIINLPLPWNK
jgi:hypothetical protein